MYFKNPCGIYTTPGDTVVLSAGVPIGQAGATNLIKVQQV